MKCRRYNLKRDGGVCPRDARQTVNGTPLCAYHADKRPLELVLDDYGRFRPWITVTVADEGGVCEGRRPVPTHKGEAKFIVNGKAYCQKHAEETVYGEALFDNFLKRLIQIGNIS